MVPSIQQLEKHILAAILLPLWSLLLNLQCIVLENWKWATVQMTPSLLLQYCNACILQCRTAPGRLLDSLQNLEYQLHLGSSVTMRVQNGFAALAPDLEIL